jgi:hypothetical protein
LGTTWHPYIPPFGYVTCALCSCQVSTRKGLRKTFPVNFWIINQIASIENAHPDLEHVWQLRSARMTSFAPACLQNHCRYIVGYWWFAQASAEYTSRIVTVMFFFFSINHHRLCKQMSLFLTYEQKSMNRKVDLKK